MPASMVPRSPTGRLRELSVPAAGFLESEWDSGERDAPLYGRRDARRYGGTVHG